MNDLKVKWGFGEANIRLDDDVKEEGPKPYEEEGIDEEERFNRLKRHLSETENFTKWIETKDHIWSAGTRKNYRIGVGLFLRRNPDILSQADVNAFLVEYTRKKENDGTKRKNLCAYYHAIKHYYDYLRIHKLITKTEMYDIIDNFPKPIYRVNTKREKDTSITELTRINGALQDPKHRLIAHLMLKTGLRVGTVLMIHRKNVDIRSNADKPHIAIRVVGKGNKANDFFIYDETLMKEFLEYYGLVLSDYGYMFLDYHDLNFKKFERAADNKKFFMDEEDYIQIRNLNDAQEYLELDETEAKIGAKIPLNSLGKNRDEVLEHILPLIMTNAVQIYTTDAEINNMFKLVQSNYLKFQEDLKKAVAAVGLDYKGITAHSYRRTYAKFVWEESGHDLYFLQQQLGHARPETTMKYLHKTSLDRKARDLIVQERILETLG